MQTNLITLLILLLFVNFTKAQIKNDDVLFTVENSPVLASEFLRVYNKNLDLVKDESQKDVDEYLKLFIVYKLKLLEAKTLEFDKNPQYLREFENYKNQLAKNYLTDHKVTDELVAEAYHRISYEVNVSHVLVKIAEHEKDTLEAYAEIVKLRNRLLSEDFETLQKDVHNGTTVFAEDLGYFSGFKMDYTFESVAYKTGVGEVSQPFRTSFGYHALKVFDKRKSRGEVTVGHIMISNNQQDSLIKPEIRIQEIYKLIQQGQNFESLAKQFSDDKSSAQNGGKLKPFSGGQLRSVEFEDIAFGLKEIGQISQPFKTEYGWHISKLYGKTPLQSFSDMEFDLEAKVRNDSRSKLINSAMAQTLKAKYKIKEATKELPYFESIVNDEFFKKNWKIPQDLDSNKPFVKIGNKQYTYSDFASFILKSQSKGLAQRSIVDLVKELYTNFLDAELIAYHEANLESENSEYADILGEYRDGLLLFDLMEAKIWNAVKQDSIGIENFYNANKANYKWNKRIDAIVAICSKEKDISKVKKMLMEGNEMETIKMELNKDGGQNVLFTTGIMDVGHQALPENFEFELGISDVYFYNDAFHVLNVKTILPETQKTLQEAKGKVISDYQDDVEKKWIQHMENTYKVQVNKDVLAKIKSLIKKN